MQNILDKMSKLSKEKEELETKIKGLNDIIIIYQKNLLKSQIPMQFKLS